MNNEPNDGLESENLSIGSRIRGEGASREFGIFGSGRVDDGGEETLGVGGEEAEENIGSSDDFDGEMGKTEGEK